MRMEQLAHHLFVPAFSKNQYFFYQLSLVFIEPEGLYTNEMYLGGMSSSMPEDVQYEMYHTVAGLENVKIVRNAYAIE